LLAPQSTPPVITIAAIVDRVAGMLLSVHRHHLVIK